MEIPRKAKEFVEENANLGLPLEFGMQKSPFTFKVALFYFRQIVLLHLKLLQHIENRKRLLRNHRQAVAAQI